MGAFDDLPNVETPAGVGGLFADVPDAPAPPPPRKVGFVESLKRGAEAAAHRFASKVPETVVGATVGAGKLFDLATAAGRMFARPDEAHRARIAPDAGATAAFNVLDTVGLGDLITRAIGRAQNVEIQPNEEPAGLASSVALKGLPGVGEMLPSLFAGMIPAGALTRAPQLVRSVEPGVRAAVRALTPELTTGVAAGVPTAIPGAERKRVELREAGASPLEAIPAAAATGLMTLGQFAAPAAVPSAARTLLGRVASRGTTGAALAGTTGAAQTGIENEIAKALGLPELVKDPLDPTTLTTSVAMGAGMGQMAGRAPRVPRRPVYPPEPTVEPVVRPEPPAPPGHIDVGPLGTDPDAAVREVVARLFEGDTSAAPNLKLVENAPPPTRRGRPTLPTNLSDMLPPRAPDLPVSEPNAPRDTRLTGEKVEDAASRVGETPESVARSFDIAYGQRGPAVEAATQASNLPPLDAESLRVIQEHMNVSPEETLKLGANSQRRLLKAAMDAEAENAARAKQGPLAATNIKAQDEGAGPASPASKPNVPGDRPAPEARTFDQQAKAAESPPDPAAVKRKAAMVEQLDAARKQREAMQNSETFASLRRRRDEGERLSEPEAKLLTRLEAQFSKLGQTIFDLEGKIYETEARTEAGSRSASGTSDRPFRTADTGPEEGPPTQEQAQQRGFRDTAEQRARDAQKEALDRLEAEWRERERIRKERGEREEAGRRRAEGEPGERYRDAPRSPNAAKEQDGTFRVDPEGFVMSDQGAPIWFVHQRDAGWWILRTGNKQAPGKVYQIANHPSGDGFTVQVTGDSSPGGGGRRGGGAGGGGGDNAEGIRGNQGPDRQGGSGGQPRLQQGAVNRGGDIQQAAPRPSPVEPPRVDNGPSERAPEAPPVAPRAAEPVPAQEPPRAAVNEDTSSTAGLTVRQMSDRMKRNHPTVDVSFNRDVNGAMYLMNIEAVTPRQGDGNRAMTEFTKWLDENGHDSALLASPKGDMPLSKLVEFYERHGYTVAEKQLFPRDKALQMHRVPKKESGSVESQRPEARPASPAPDRGAGAQAQGVRAEARAEPERPTPVEPQHPAEEVAPPLSRGEAEAEARRSEPPRASRITGGSLLKAIKDLGGINSRAANDLVGEHGFAASQGAARGLFRPMRRKGTQIVEGHGLDDLATQLRDKGYNIPDDPVDGGVAALREMILDELNGVQKHYPGLREDDVFESMALRRARERYSPEEEAQLRRDMEEELRAQGLSERDAADFDAVVEAHNRDASAMEALAADVESGRIAEAEFLRETQRIANERAGAEADEGRAGGEQEAPRAGDAAREDFELEQPTPEQLREREQQRVDAERDAEAEGQRAERSRQRELNAAELREREERVRKERADAAVDDFQLGQEPPRKTVNRDEAAGQRGLLDEGQAEGPEWHIPNAYDTVTRRADTSMQGWREIGKNQDGNTVYEAGGARRVVDGEWAVTEVAHKPRDERVAEFKTTAEAPGPRTTGPGSTLYSGLPLGEMFKWLGRGVERLTGPAGEWKAAALAMKDMAKAVADAFVDQGKHVFGKTPGESPIGRIARTIFYNVHSHIVAFGEAHSSPTIQKIADMIYPTAGKEQSGQSFHEQSESHVAQRQKELEGIRVELDRLVKTGVSDGQIISMVENPRSRQGKAGELAGRIAKWLKEEEAYQREAGVDIGHVENYFPREYDRSKIVPNRRDFIRDATLAYETMGLSHDEAKLAADAFWYRRTYGADGTPGGDFGGAGNPLFTRTREFTPEAARHVKDWRTESVSDTLEAYLMRSTRLSEITRRFGYTAKELQAMRDAGRSTDGKEGAWGKWGEFEKQIKNESPELREKDVHELRAMVASAMGFRPPTFGAAIHQGAQILRMWTALATMPKSAFSSISESVAPIFRSNGDLAVAATQLRNVLYENAKSLLSQAAGEGRTAHMQRLFDWAADIGVLVESSVASPMRDRWLGDDVTNKTVAGMTAKFFKLNMLDQLTNWQRALGIDAARVFIRRQSLRAADGGNAAKFYLKELGVPAAKLDEFAAFVRKLGDDLPDASMLGGEMGQLYRNAQVRFSDQSIQRPNAATRPRWANTELGSVVFQLQGFANSYHKNVLLRQKNLMVEAYKGDYTSAERAQLAAGMIPGMMMSAAVAGLVWEVRDRLFNKTPPDRTTWAKVERALSASGALGALDPYFNMIGGLRYQRTPASAASGPAFGAINDVLTSLGNYVMNNSEKTNTAERRATDVFYQWGIEPAATALMAATPVPVRALTQALTVLALPAARQRFVDAVAGPKAKKPQQIRGIAEGRAPPKSEMTFQQRLEAERAR